MYDFIESVLIRPKMYTISGTYGEVVAFLEGYYSGLAKNNPDSPEVVQWSIYRDWLSQELGQSSVVQLVVLHNKFGDKSLEIFGDFYRRFKSITDETKDFD